jgi:hypothetical protein
LIRIKQAPRIAVNIAMLPAASQSLIVVAIHAQGPQYG